MAESETSCIIFLTDSTWANPEGGTGDPDPPGKSQKYRVS